ALLRLGDEAGLAPLAQEFTDVLFRHFDAGLREAAVGDLAVPRRMRRIAGSFYGRLEAYSKGLAAVDNSELAAAISRNALGSDAATPFAGVLADYMRTCRALQAAAPADAMFRFDGWPPAPA
ncbi:MAG: ubiquinol-cytochrome C chaperone family protein, partial [Terricaulis silvestris]